MNKGVLVGGGLGLLALAFLAGVWLTSSPADRPLAPAKPATNAAGISTPPQAALGHSNPVQQASSGSTENGSVSAPGVAAVPSQDAPWSVATPVDPAAESKPRMSRAERREARAAVRAKMAELLAKGNSVTLEDSQKLMDEVEALGQGQFDARYFGAMRKLIAQSARVQALNKELAQISTQKTPQADARRTEILGEMRDLGDRMSNGAQAMQSYARDALAGKQP